ncbi:MAG: META domain-containing protein [Pseudotabrizicola sp.]|uniref:META domain-containing protein n=1 Tax=Pseudotabrizicola sp. TaxID=2939647 RepID=UPI0027300895|nr:META domain-containing protein [Pseudotabrizicola sp.]MDP2080438.1 META domain-containing protein [Pseudotabrizicola sp.]MDZ7573718.1 META domain-containing protein [Pseudotabrizicola sp.]
MTRLTFALTAALGLAACLPAVAYGVPPEYLAIEWKLVSIDGQPFLARGNLDLSTAGKIAGQGPCNRFFAEYGGTLPDFRLGAIGATRMACPDLAAESAMFAALGQMTRAEVTGPVTLLLTGPKGGSMEFVRPMN